MPALTNFVSAFVSKVYNLTDYLLNGGDRISHLYLILGANAAYCFHDYAIPFGDESVYIQTKFGVMMIGNMKQMMFDLNKLSVNVKVQSICLEVNCLGFLMTAPESTVKLCNEESYDLSMKCDPTVQSIDADNKLLELECSRCLHMDMNVLNLILIL